MRNAFLNGKPALFIKNVSLKRSPVEYSGPIRDITGLSSSSLEEKWRIINAQVHVTIEKLIVSAGGVIFLTAILSFLTPVLVESSISWASPKENPSGARKTGLRGIPAGFDVLRKAQKDIQHDLGLPETPSSPSSETRDTSSNGSSPYTAGTLLVIAVMGLFALFFIVYRETRRLGRTGRAETTGFSPERFSDDISEESPAFPEFPDISSLLMKENLAEFPDYELPRNIEQSGRELAEKLDTILSFIRRGLGRFREDVRLSLYHFDESSGFPILLSLSSGKKYPDFYWPPPLSGLFAEKYPGGKGILHHWFVPGRNAC